MKLSIKVDLDTGGEIIVQGENLSAEDVNEVFLMFVGHTVVSRHVRPEKLDDPPPEVRVARAQRDLIAESETITPPRNPLDLPRPEGDPPT